MRWFVAFLCVLVAAPAAAQSTYVGAAVVGDISRFSKVDVDDVSRATAFLLRF